MTAPVAVPLPRVLRRSADAASRRGTVRGNPEVAGAWWTEADQAEFDVLVYALVRGIFRHREHCAACARSGSAVYCRAVERAVEEMLDWLQLRSLLSRAEYLADEKHTRQAGRAA